MNDLVLDFSNVLERPNRRLLRVAQKIVPGIAKVQSQIEPYAQAWQQHNKAALAASGPLWVVFGDSMAQGIGASSYDKGWVGQLQTHLTQDGHAYRLVNFSMSGARIQDALELQLPMLQKLSLKPDLVTVLIGSNDLLRSQYRKKLLGRYHQLLEQLPAGSYVVSPFGNFGIGRQANALLAQTAKGGKIIAVQSNLGQNYHSWKGKLAADRFHPNDAGYKDIATIYYQAITRHRA